MNVEQTVLSVVPVTYTQQQTEQSRLKTKTVTSKTQLLGGVMVTEYLYNRKK
jgi:hypothetical protein